MQADPPPGQDGAAARRLWHALEPLHAVAYFAPEVVQACKDLGLKGFWMSYFAGRAAPLGAVGPAVVTATFFNFHPRMVRRALPDAWAFAAPPAVLSARMDAAARALSQLLGESAALVDEAATLARAACENLDVAGRPLAAAWADVPWPEDPVAILWLASTVLREHRGDGHVAALVAEGVGGCEAHVLAAAHGLTPREVLQPNRGWSDEDWAGAGQRLATRGWLDHDGRITPAGRALREHVERRTDALAEQPLHTLGRSRLARLQALADHLAERVHHGDILPFPNPIGLPPR